MDDYKPRLGKYGLPEEALQSNADAYKREHPDDIPEKKERKPVVVKKKKSRLTDNFIMKDLKSVAVDIFWDDIIPTIRNTIVDTLENAVEMIFLGEKKTGKKKRPIDRTSYQGYYERPRRTVSPRRRFDVETITYNTRREAEEVRELILDHLDDYQILTVANVYDLSGIDAKDIPFTAEKYGWISDSIRNVDISRVRDGYVIELPRPKELE